MLSRQQIVKQIAATTPREGLKDLADPNKNLQWTVDETTGVNSWIRHEGITLTWDERQEVVRMIQEGDGQLYWGIK